MEYMAETRLDRVTLRDGTALEPNGSDGLLLDDEVLTDVAVNQSVSQTNDRR